MLKNYILNMANLRNAINKMILSPSGFRKIFAKSKDENSTDREINDERQNIDCSYNPYNIKLF
ncbi:Phosphomannomutase [Borrelia hermsii YBT]|nr:Phosphomannomutase [Borrelia hermsii YBT]